MKTKEETVEHLKSLGYKAYVDGFEVMVSVDHILNDKEHKKLEKAITGFGYRSSWGWRVTKKVNE